MDKYTQKKVSEIMALIQYHNSGGDAALKVDLGRVIEKVYEDANSDALNCEAALGFYENIDHREFAEGLFKTWEDDIGKKGAGDRALLFLADISKRFWEIMEGE